ncbi:MAG: sensor domain-containing protein [Candidatus Krumholzibacteria bacterium]|nr:sensor domain-containing protein [Candidatus Krumholzibacteria bacterium]
MSDMIKEYLDSLEKALSGSDPATVRDALGDAEEHLRTALDAASIESPDVPEDELIRGIIEDYGTPEEVADAYRRIEKYSTPVLAGKKKNGNRSAAARFFGVMVDPRAYGAMFYGLFALVTGIIYFTWAVTGLSLSVGLAVMIFGIPFFGLFLLSVQGLMLVEGRIIEALSGIRMPRRPVASRKGLNVWQKFVALVKDKRSWSSILYMILQLIFGIVHFTVTISLLAFSASFILRPILEYTFEIPMMHISGIEYWTPIWAMPLTVLIGAVLLVTTLHAARGMTRLHARWAKFMLVR